MEVMTIEDQFILKSKVYFNNESLKILKRISGSRAFIVADSIMETLGYLQKTIDYLGEAGIITQAFLGVRPDPDTVLITEGMKQFQESEADILVAIGGGSAIDTAKAILYCTYKLQQAEGLDYQKPLFIAIPSTSGTGSEVTDFSVVTSQGEKICIVDEILSPDIAILDSTCIQHVPQRVIADTGIDVLVHAVEAYVSKKATDFTDALAEKAIKLIFEHLETLYHDTGNTQARDHILNASCMAGMAFTNTGLGINHSLAHALGGTFHIPHGRANGLLMKRVMEYNADLAGKADSYATERYARLAALLNLPSRTKREGAVNFIQAVDKLKKALGIEASIHSLGIDQSQFEQALESMAEAALLDHCTPTSPKEPSKDDLIQIYIKAYMM